MSSSSVDREQDESNDDRNIMDQTDGGPTSSSSLSSGNDPNRKSVRQALMDRIGFLPRDAFGWLYACRGLYKNKEYHLVVEGLTHCLRHDKTRKEAQHLLAFSLLHTGQTKSAASAFYKSVKIGNHTDWQPLVELCIDHPTLKFTS